MAEADTNAALQLVQEKISAGQFSAALEDLRPFLDDEDSATALYMSAVCYRYLKRFDDAHLIVVGLAFLDGHKFDIDIDAGQLNASFRQILL